MSIKNRLTILVSMMCLWCAAASAQVTITLFRPVTTDNTVKVEAKIVSQKSEQVKLNATITSCDDNKVVWSGELPSLKVTAGDTATLNHIIEGIEAKLWTPVAPHLHNITITAGESSATKRVGFRSFQMVDGRFLLNGKPIFLRGNAINPPGRGIPGELEESKEFARDYVRFLKGMNINLIRIRNNQDWLDVCDEEGMMVFGGRYGRPRTGTESTPPQDFDWSIRHYKEVELGPLQWHPSVVILILSNEQAYSGNAGAAYDKFLSAAHKELVKWDNSRPYIGNAGYGLGRNADVYDVHRYWGWYYNSFLTFLNLRDMKQWQNEGKTQAITFTECVGNYTGIDGRYNLCSRTKQPYSQLCWTGHTPQDEQGDAALKYQAFVLKNTVEFFRRLRSQNERLSGVMPFSIIFHDWDGIKTFSQMKPKPVAFQYGTSYQPILLSWEMWMPNVYASAAINSVIHVVNDDDNMCDLDSARVEWALEDINRIPVIKGTIELPKIAYYDTYRQPLKVNVPATTPTGYYNLRGTIMRAGKVVSQNNTEVFIAGVEWRQNPEKGREIALYDTKGLTAKAFDNLGIAYQRVTNVEKLNPKKILVIGELSWDAALTASQQSLTRFIDNAGRIVCLRQQGTLPTDWIPAKVKMLTDTNNSSEYLGSGFTYMDGMNINMERDYHPVFKGISRDKLRLWSDYTGFDESKEGFPAIYPVTQGFDLAGNDFGNITVYANYSRGLAATALCEITKSKGAVILSGFDIAPRCGIDPVADRLLSNIINYARSNETSNPYTVVNKPIVWGDYASENGIVSLANNGLIVNTAPIVPIDQREKLPTVYDDMGYWYAGEKAGGWNTKPGVQYMPYGRRPFSNFTYSSGGNVVAQGDNRNAKGFFLADVPQGSRQMVTTVLNPSQQTIKLAIAVNGKATEFTIAPDSTQDLLSPLPEQTKLRIEFTGDRKAVLLRTEFKH